MGEATKIKVKTKSKISASDDKKPKKAIDIGLPKGMDAMDTESDSQKLQIHSRPLMREGGESKDSEAGSPDPHAEPPSAPPLSPSQKKIVPVSIHDGKEAATADESNSDETDATGENNLPAASPPEVEKPAAETQPKKEEQSSADESDASSESADADKQTPSGDQTKQAVEAAEAQLRRDSELEELINKREFYVPINARARKRSVHVSAAMLVLVVVLAAFLLDLMLDSGMIQLSQDVPHTHLFSNLK
jgi:hypothetical protein